MSEKPATVVVQKYGGSSVADTAKMKRVAERVARTREAGHRVVVVVSAMGDTTDELLRLANEITEHPERRELDMLLTAGERISMALLSMALHDLGVQAISFTGSQSGIITNDAHAGARVIEVRPYRIQDELARDRVVIVAGYQGVSYKKEVTTLGRGGSDTTAVALAAALGAEYCEICSDVDGVYTADPRVVDTPRRLAELTHEEMQTLAESGAKVLHAAAVEYARRAGIAIWARATRSDPKSAGDGSLVRVAGPDEPPRVVGVAAREVVVARGPALDADAVARVGRALADAGVSAPWLQWDEDDGELLALVPTDDLHGIDLVATLSEALGGDTEVVEGQAAVTCVGAGLESDPQVLEAVVGACSEADAPPIAVDRSSLRLTVVVPAARADAVVRAVHEALVGGRIAG